MSKYGWCHITLKIILEGEEVLWDDLSEITQEHISQKLLEGYRSIEICEEDDDDLI